MAQFVHINYKIACHAKIFSRKGNNLNFNFKKFDACKYFVRKNVNDILIIDWTVISFYLAVFHCCAETFHSVKYCRIRTVNRPYIPRISTARQLAVRNTGNIRDDLHFVLYFVQYFTQCLAVSCNVYWILCCLY